MPELSPDLSRLMAIGKTACRSSPSDLERNFEVLLVRLAKGGTQAASTEPVTPATRGISSKLLLAQAGFIGFVGIAVVASLFLLTARQPRAPRIGASTPAASVVQTNESSAAAPATSTEPAPLQVGASAEADAPTVASGHPPVRATAIARSRENLADEVELISRAELALQHGKPELALALLDLHERRFGSGLLTQEQIAARIQSLCALGRKTEASAQLSRLSPKSIHGAAARGACAAPSSQ